MKKSSKKYLIIVDGQVVVPSGLRYKRDQQGNHILPSYIRRANLQLINKSLIYKFLIEEGEFELVRWGSVKFPCRNPKCESLLEGSAKWWESADSASSKYEGLCLGCAEEAGYDNVHIYRQ